MSDPLASLLIPQAYQDSDGLVTETTSIPASSPYTFRLGSTLSPAYPSGVPLIPAGAAPLSNAPAPTAGAGLTTGALVSNGTYSWALSLVTKFGETQPTNLLTISGIGAGNTGQTINLPAGTTGTGTNPVLSRRLWRTKNTGSQLYLVAEVDDANVSSYVDEVSDTELVVMAPTSNNSGLEGAISITGTNGGGGTTWTEMPEGTTLSAYGQFTVSYDVSNNGGIITFYSGDAGKAVSVQYSAATFMGSAYYNLYKTALSFLHGFLPSTGVAALSSAGLFQGSSAAGVPTISNVPSGSTVTVLPGSTNARGTIKVVVASSGPALGANTRACTVTFGSGPLPTIPSVILGDGSNINLSPSWYYQNKSASSFDLMYGGTTGTNIDAYYCDYVCIA